MNKEVTVIIPTWKPGRELTQLLLRLKRQSVPPERMTHVFSIIRLRNRT